MNNSEATYDSGAHRVSGGGRAGIVLALLMLLGALFNACMDQPVDSTGVSVIRDTVINVRYDTVIFNNTDTVIVTMTDTIIVEKRDTIIVPENRWDTIIVRDTIRDTIRSGRIDTVTVFDTIEVPKLIDRYRKATLSYRARNDSLGMNGPLVTLSVDLTEWLQYKVVDSNGTIIAIGLSMSAAIPLQYRRYAVGSLQTTAPFYLRGLALNIPVARTGNDAVGDSIPLNRHPYNLLPMQDRNGGMMISAQVGDQLGFMQGWTGQVIEASVTAGGQRYQSWGRWTLNRMKDRTLFGQIHGVVYVSTELNQRQVVEQFEVTIELELGY